MGTSLAPPLFVLLRLLSLVLRKFGASTSEERQPNFIRTPGDQTASENSEHVPKEFRSMKRVEILLTLLVVLAVGAFASASAQTSKGFVTGTVEDQNGAGIANASVKITNITTGVARETTADSSGSFRLDAV